MRDVVIYKNGERVGLFTSIKDAAAYVGVSSATLLGRIVRKAEIGGIRAEYAGRRATFKQVKYSARASESITEEEAQATIQDFADHGVEIYKIPYEKAKNAILCTPCRKKSLDVVGTFPFVASARCVSCCHFKGKNQQAQYVLCSHSAPPKLK